MSEKLSRFIDAQKSEIERALREALPMSSITGAARLNDALEYAVFPGGKRLRPVLSILGARLAGAAREQTMAVACAVEFLHSSSLILDDLPGMDDARLRRDRPALHITFGEGLAVLAAVALLNQSYALLAEAARACKEERASAVLIVEAARCVGADGMVGGQAVDLEARTLWADRETLASRDLKTVALMRLMMTAGAIACGGGRDTPDVRALSEFGECFGRAYQVCDDILDDGSAHFASTGKTEGQDARHLRPNAVSAFGLAGAHALAAQLIEQGVARLNERFGRREEVELLADAARLIALRTQTAVAA